MAKRKSETAKRLLKEEGCIYCHYGTNGDAFMNPFPQGGSRVCAYYEPGSTCGEFTKREYKEIYSYFIGLQE